MTRNLDLALKMLARDWRSGELGILAAALFIAVVSSTAVSLLGDRLNRTMVLQAAEFLGGDLAVRGHETPPPEWNTEAQKLGLRTSGTTEFSSVLYEGDEVLLVGIKAAAAGYPLHGKLKISRDDIAAAETTDAIPAPGEAWAEARVLTTLGVKLDDSITVGEKPLKVTRLLIHEPDRRGDLYSLAPRVIINAADLEATRVIQAGSHVHYQALFAGNEKALRQFKDWLKPRLHPGQRIADVNEDRPELGTALSRAERYLGLTSIAVVLIAGVAIAMSARRYTERHFDMAAMLKCLGARNRDVLQIFLMQFALLGITVSALGCAVGYGIQEAVVELIHNLLPQTLATPGPFALLLGSGAGLLILFGFTLPPLIRLKGLPPLRVLRRDLTPLPSSAWLVYGTAVIALGLLMWRYTHDWLMTGTILAVAVLVMILFGGIGLFLLSLGGRLIPYVPLSWRFGLQHLTRRRAAGVSQILAFSITLVAMQVSLMVQNELVQEWQRQLPAETPNHFVINLFDADLDRFQSFLEENGIGRTRLYPVVRGRLTKIEGKDVLQMVSKESRAEGAINRELSLTYTDAMPKDNKVVGGRWWQADDLGKVSVEAELAKNLGIKVGDHLTFNIAGQDMDAEVIGTRSVRWDSMTPNFFMIFAPGSLDAHPRTWLTSFFLPPAQKPLLASLAKEFPGVTILEVDALIKQIQGIVNQITQAIHYVLLMALAAGFTVLFASVRASLDERLHEDALLRAIGASGRLLRTAQWVEFSALGFLAGILAAAMAEGITWVLFSRVFDLGYRFHWETWIIAPTLGALGVGLAGYWNTRTVVRNTPLHVLREL